MQKNEYKNVSIRYNTQSDGETNCWRVICDGIEYQTNKVVVKGELITTKDLIDGVGFKHHVTIEDAIVEYSVDYTLIKNRQKFLYKDILKTITYRILGTSVTFGIGFFSTGNLNVAVALGFSDLVLKPIIYFVHERLWHLSRS